MSNKLLGRYIKYYREGKGVPISVKVLTISLLWLTIGYSIIFIVEAILVRLILTLIAIGVTIHVLSIKTFRQ